MAQSSVYKTQGYIAFPRQKLSDAEKTDEWYKQNINFAENILTTDTHLRASFKNKETNYKLATNKINPKDFEQYINPDKLDLKSLPASFQHIGIENSKINLLVGEYQQRRKEYRAYLSSSDSDSLSRKEGALIEKIKQELTDIVKKESISEEEVQKRMKALEKYQTYEFQDVAEITANKILKKEYKTQNLDFLFSNTFEDLLRVGEQMVYCGVLGGEPVMRRVDPRNVYTIGGNSMRIEDSDVIVVYGYDSIGQVIDDYYDVLKPADVELLETGKGLGEGLNRDMSINERFGPDSGISLLDPSASDFRLFGGAFDTEGKVRVLKVFWRSRRKIGKRMYYDEDGEQQKDYVPEDYKVDKASGETVEWQWVNEWLEGVKIADDIYPIMRPLPYASRSIVNKSKGLPPIIGSVNSTNGTEVQGLVDVMKPLSYSYDIAYYKRELEIATYSGSFTAVNASLIPSGWDPKEWMRYVKVNKFGWLDPTNEILKGPSQGKSAGAFNTLTAQNISVGDPNAIQIYTNILLDIENTLGKLAGVTGAREGQIQNREAVGNVEREVAQTSHITEKWFTIDANFRKRALGKFLECCKYAYKENPQKGQFLLDDMAQVTLEHFDEWNSSDYDIHIANSTADTKLFEDLMALSQAAIQNGQATITDIAAMHQTESIQELSKKLEDSAARIREENNKMQQEAQQMEAQAKQADMQMKQAEMAWEKEKFVEESAIKREEIAAKIQIAAMKDMGDADFDGDGDGDENDNGIRDYIDTRKVDIDERVKTEKLAIDRAKLQETVRSNRAKEQIARSKPKNIGS